MALKGELKISVDCVQGKSRLQDYFFTPPFKIMNITEGRNSSALKLMIMNSSPGVLDRDEYCITLCLKPNASLELSTQAYQRLFQMENGAVQNMKVQMEKGSSFVYLPHPCVPHAFSRFRARTEIFLEDDCGLIIGEVLSNGRNLNGESFLFTRYQSTTQVFLNHQLIISDNQVIEPLKGVHQKPGMMEGYSHQASMMILSNRMNCNSVLEQIRQQSFPDVCIGVSRLAVNGIAIRMLGSKAEQLHHHLQSISQLSMKDLKISNASHVA